MHLTRSTSAVAEAQQGTQRPQPLNTGAGSERKLAVLIVTAMYPHSGHQSSGAFVMQQVEQLRTLGHDVETIHLPGHPGVLGSPLLANMCYSRSIVRAASNASISPQRR
jgi:hypothetical protein